MYRRDFLKSMSLVAGHVLFPSVLAEFLQGCGSNISKQRPQFFSDEQINLLAEVVDTIIPATDSPGAKEAQVHFFIDLAVKQCYSEDQQTIFVNGLTDLQTICQEKYKTSFSNAAKEDRLALLLKIEDENWQGATDRVFIRMLKDLALTGYFNSRIGATQATEYVHIPGEYKGCIKLVPGKRAWATI